MTSKCIGVCIFYSSLVSSYELRELEAKLRAAYMNKERAAQLAEKEVLQKKDKVCVCVCLCVCVCVCV